ncbi:MAG: PIG-L deacetylase family protein, partial [Myxococcota bacterium]
MKSVSGEWMRVLVALALVGLVSGCATPPAARSGIAGGDGPRRVLVVVAHPDDENMAGPFLAKLARQGHDVRLVIATDGKYGTRATDLPPDELGPLRRRESECAALALGIPPPIFLAIDRLDTKNGVRAYLDGRRQLLTALGEQLDAFAPDALFTFGPDGEYGHPEHIVVGAALTEVLLRDGLVEKYPLYYLAWAKEQVADDDELSYVDARYLSVKATHTDADERKSFEAARCYASQTKAEEIEALVRDVSADRTSTYFFRRFAAPAGAPVPGFLE